MNTPSLFTKHRGLAFTISADYFLPGADREDVQQEALIALWEAARTYDISRGAFPAFAGSVIRNHLGEQLTRARAGKRRLLTEAVRDLTLLEAPSEEDRLQARDELHAVAHALPALTEIERIAVIGLACGESYATLAALTGARNKKQIDNAVQRARAKLRVACQREAA